MIRLDKNKVIFSILIPLFLSAGLEAQPIIENPKKPLSPNAGRVLHLKEVTRIGDETGKFFFREPYELQTSSDGSVFVKEINKLYKFDADVKFIKDIIKLGQGPGEITTEFEDFVLTDNEIVFLCATLNKILKTDMQGNLIQETKLGEKRFFRLLAYWNNRYFLLDSPKRQEFKKKSGIIEYSQNLYAMDEKGANTALPYSVSLKEHKTIFQGGVRTAIFSTPVTRLQMVRKDQRYLYLCHTSDYLIKLFDCEKQEVIRTFRREYSPLKFTSEEKYPDDWPKYQNDVQRLVIHKDNLWVLTSTRDKKGILVDVFNQEGKYLDNFYLPLMKTWNLAYLPIATHGDILYVMHSDEQENIVLFKYQILD
jgi:hypothetical protein